MLLDINGGVYPLILGSIGLGLILAEVFITSTFVVFWVGLAVIATAVLSYFFDISWQYQLISISGLSWGLYALLSRKFQTQNKESLDDALHQARKGDFALACVNDGHLVLKYAGTYWANFDCEDRNSSKKHELKADDRVEVVCVIGNKLLVRCDQ